MAYGQGMSHVISIDGLRGEQTTVGGFCGRARRAVISNARGNGGYLWWDHDRGSDLACDLDRDGRAVSGDLVLTLTDTGRDWQLTMDSRTGSRIVTCHLDAEGRDAWMGVLRQPVPAAV